MITTAHMTPAPYFEVTWPEDRPGVRDSWHLIRGERPPADRARVGYGWDREGARRELTMDGDDYDVRVHDKHEMLGFPAGTRTDVNVIAEGATEAGRDLAALEQALVAAMSVKSTTGNALNDPVRFRLEHVPGVEHRLVSFPSMEAVPQHFRAVLREAQRVADRWDRVKLGGRPLVVDR